MILKRLEKEGVLIRHKGETVSLKIIISRRNAEIEKIYIIHVLFLFL